MVVGVIGHNIFGKKKLGVKVSENLELVQAYQVFFFLLPLWFNRRILAYDFSKKKYYDFDDKLENRLLKLGRKASSEQLNNVIKQYEKEEKERVNYYKIHKNEIEEKENQEFMAFLKGIGIVVVILILIIVVKNILF